MRPRNFIPIVDLFAGPGGLGEGFSSLERKPFRILVSAEMDEAAHKTLRMRAFYRMAAEHGGSAIRMYYDFCNGDESVQARFTETRAWQEAEQEALRLTLGDPDDNRRLDTIIRRSGLGPGVPWVLIGGPPCQAYSLVGRSRNRGKTDYRAEDDHRHFLYKEYLRIIQKYRPSVFVMENVKGILSSSVGEQRIFHSILRDLADPDKATGAKASGFGYRIHSLSSETRFERSKHPEDIDVADFIVRAEEYGIPQARHRVILLGVREDLHADVPSLEALARKDRPVVEEAFVGLPRLRSRLSRQADSADIWVEQVRQHFIDLQTAAEKRNLQSLLPVLRASMRTVTTSLGTGSLRVPKFGSPGQIHPALRHVVGDDQLTVWLNHEARGHMSSDLLRYAYASAFARAEGRSPKGHVEFDLLERLHPAHANWESGKFADRFRVQLAGTQATTVTSHISKDGHYFIHYDPVQCRSLTVREAARLQTFPDNYFFQGNRTEQFHQVGNAVPPMLARQIANIVNVVLRRAARKKAA